MGPDSLNRPPAPRPFELAQFWARTKQDLDKLREEEAAIRKQREISERNLEDTSKELRSLMGNVPRRVFDLGNGTLVMVSAVAGVELITVETDSER